MNNIDIKNYVLANPDKVKTVRSKRYPNLMTLKYSRNVFFDDAFDDYLEECRGLVVDDDWNVVQKPFKKIYNFGIEKRAPVLADDVPVIAMKKYNGFMGAITWHNGDFLCSTTGSLDSDFCDMLRESLEAEPLLKAMIEARPQFTYLFECVHENDPHIIKERPGLYSIGARVKCNESFANEETLFLPNETTFTTTVGDLKSMAKLCIHEGFVAYTLDMKQSFKIKSPYYLTTKWLARSPKIARIVDLKNDVKKSMDEEFYPVIDFIRNNKDGYLSLDEQGRIELIEKMYI